MIIQFCQILTKKKEKEDAVPLSWKNKLAKLPARSLTMFSTLVAVSVAVNTIYVENWIDIALKHNGAKEPPQHAHGNN